jgi:hypothetical protein
MKKEMRRYTLGEFVQIAINRLVKEDKDKQTAFAIAQEVWSEFKSKD